MDLEGALADNLRGAIASATRLLGHPVHKDTLELWSKLLTHARGARRRARVMNVAELDILIGELESCLQAHQQAP